MNLPEHLKDTLRRRFPALVTPRNEDTHKGSYGTVAVVGGTAGMSGAVCLATSAAMYMGCGKSFAVFCQARLPFAIIPGHPEIMLRTAADIADLRQSAVFIIGCGMGVSPSTGKLLCTLATGATSTLLLDADALTLLARNRALVTTLAALQVTKILTPHPAEAARLLDTTTASIQKHRETCAGRLAEKYRGWVVLKGNHSVIASPQGKITGNDSGNAGLATAGSGDVLSGMIGGLLAQGLPPREAVCGGVWLHGAAAECLGQGIALPGLLAGEIAPAARALRQSATQGFAC